MRGFFLESFNQWVNSRVGKWAASCVITLTLAPGKSSNLQILELLDDYDNDYDRNPKNGVLRWRRYTFIEKAPTSNFKPPTNGQMSCIWLKSTDSGDQLIFESSNLESLTKVLSKVNHAATYDLFGTTGPLHL